VVEQLLVLGTQVVVVELVVRALMVLAVVLLVETESQAQF
jgi:hypothetical protein